uniref:SOS-response transcriptional repressor n=1 Tax=Siphoviridae sp. ct5co22 TaxID=2826294 RepID=A0A8S5QU54_9CAUD|nr:MAG TPA: SOS-response transcriptional repressor [Siphoviridae sp. ct5co22]
MAKRDTVNVDCEKVIPLIRSNEWNNFAFSRKVGKYNSWFGEVLRGKNLPSPEEAARMCILLNTTPEKILLHEGKTEAETVKCQEDIKLVQELVEKEMGIKNPPSESTEDDEEEFIRLFQLLPPEVQERELAYLRQLAARAADQDK